MHPERNDIQNVLRAIGREEPPADLRGRILQACETATPVEEICCDECVELASAYIDRELCGARRDAFEAHVFSCEPCYLAFKQMERTAEVLRDTSPAAAPADLHERITAAVARDAAVQSVFTWRRAARVLGGLAAAAALLAAIVLPRGGDGVDVTAPVVAEAPREVAAGVIDEPDVVAEAAEPVAETGEPAGTEETQSATESLVAAAPSPADSTRRTRSPETPRADATPTASEAAPEPVRESPAVTTRVAPEPERAVRAPEPQPRPAPARDAARDAAEPAPPQSDEEPVVAEEPRAPAPEHARTPTVTPEPPAAEPRPRETAVAAAPRTPAPEPAPVTASSPAPAPSATAQAPRPGADAETTRVAVVPRQPRARAVYHPTPTPPAERSEKLARMAEGINGSQTPRFDNPSTGIELN